jgi:leucyl aminopeptidase
MRVSFVSVRPTSTADLALLVPKDGIAAAVAGNNAASALQGAATLARFDGDAGGVVEYVSVAGDMPQRVLLAGVGGGTPEEFEKAGSALCARLLISGATSLVVDASGAPAASAARLAAVFQLRGWRYDKYRTKLTDKQKPTLNEVIVVNGEPGLEAAWANASAVVDGMAFTRELVTEPANIIYPESFVERCQKLAEVGVQIEVLDEAAMEAAGMG